MSLARKRIAARQQAVGSARKGLAHLRQSAGLSQRELAKITGLTQAHIYRCENGGNPTIDVVGKLASALEQHIGTVAEALLKGRSRHG